MTFILVDRADPGRQPQPASRAWDCIMSKMEREQGFTADTPHHLISHVLWDGLAELLEFASVSRDVAEC